MGLTGRVKDSQTAAWAESEPLPRPLVGVNLDISTGREASGRPLGYVPK